VVAYERLGNSSRPPSTSWLAGGGEGLLATRPTPLLCPDQNPPITMLALRETAVNPPPSYVIPGSSAGAPRPPLMMPTDLRTGHSASAVYDSSRGSAHEGVSQADDASEGEEEGSRLVIRE
jgi:hypothetical protein